MTASSVIRQFRDRNGLTQDDLGERVGVAAATISRWEKGRREPRGKRLRKLSEVIGIPIAEILDAPSLDPAAEAAQ